MGRATTRSTVRNVSNTGQMSSSTHRTGATGAVSNNTTIINRQGAAGASGASTSVIRTQGDPGYQLGQVSDVIKNYRQLFGL